MGFQIRNAQKEALSLNDLDKEACTLWGKETDPKWYGSPIKITPKPESFASLEERRHWDAVNFKEISNEMSNNWFDVIGRIIHNGADSWEVVKATYIKPYQAIVDEYKGNEEVRVMIMEEGAVKGLVDLIDLWEKQGYTPHPVQD